MYNVKKILVQNDALFFLLIFYSLNDPEKMYDTISTFFLIK